MAPDGVDERHVAHEPVVVHVAAVMEGLVDQVLRHHRDEHEVAGVGVEDQGRHIAQPAAAHTQRRQHAPREEHDAEFARGVDSGFLVGEILVMLARMALIDGAQREHVDPAVHDVAVHEPFDEVAGQEHRQYQGPFPRDVVQALDRPVQRGDAHAVDHGDVQQPVIKRADIGLVLLPELALAFSHHDCISGKVRRTNILVEYKSARIQKMPLSHRGPVRRGTLAARRIVIGRLPPAPCRVFPRPASAPSRLPRRRTSPPA
ncbi:hypothetical protein D3C86_1559090 [compost metagenome]